MSYTVALLDPHHSCTGTLGTQEICPEAAVMTKTMWMEAGNSQWDTLSMILLGMSRFNKKKEPKHRFRDREKKK